MRLVIETDDGAAYYVLEQLENCNFSSDSDRETILEMIQEVIQQAQEETDDYKSNFEDMDTLEDEEDFDSSISETEKNTKKNFNDMNELPIPQSVTSMPKGENK